MTASPCASRGFSLLEIAIVMTISGLMMVGIVKLLDLERQEQALRITRQRMAAIQEKLDLFADRNERLPCPVAPADGPMAAAPPSCSVTPPAGERDVPSGILPVTALNLTPEDAKDGWGNMFTYAVSAVLTQERGMRGVNPPPGVIGIVNAYGDNILDTPDRGRYVIVSHGPRGAGGFRPNGVGIPCPEGTLSAKNCHAKGVFVMAPWSTARGPFFFDNIVAGDGSRRQARLLEHVDYCGQLGKYYAPERFFADKDGCVADDKVFGACTIETSYMDHGMNSPFTGDWDEPPQAAWAPAESPPKASACECDEGYNPLQAGAWELPLHHPEPPPTLRQYCKLGADHQHSAIIKDLCDSDPPALDIREMEWSYDYIATMDGKVWKQKGSVWLPTGEKSWSILPITARDPDTGVLVKAKAAAHKGDIRVRHIVWTAPLVEKNHKLTLYTCIRK